MAGRQRRAAAALAAVTVTLALLAVLLVVHTARRGAAPTEMVQAAACGAGAPCRSRRRQAQLEQLAGSASAPQLLSPQSVDPRYYPTVPKTPSALARNDYPPLKVVLNETDYSPGYDSAEPGDLNVYSRRTPSVWVNAGMAEAPGTTLTQQAFALNLIQPRVERDQRKLEMEFKAAREGRGNLTLDGSPVVVTGPALAIHKVMQRKEQMKWTIEHWNDDCFDYSPHYVQSMPSGNVRRGEQLQPCPAEEEPEDQEETPLEPSPGVDQAPAPEQETQGSEEGAAEGREEENSDAAQGKKKAKMRKKAQVEAEETARRVLKGFRDVQIDGRDFVPVFIPSGHPELATARFPHGVQDRVQAQHAIHRSLASQSDDGGAGVLQDNARLRGAGHGGGRGSLAAVQQGGSFASKIAGVEHLVQGIMASLSLQPGTASKSRTGLRKAGAGAAGESAVGSVGGAGRARGRSEQEMLLRRLRGVVRQLSTLRRGPIAARPAGSPRSSLQQQPGQQAQPGQAAWGDYEWGQYAASHKASGAVVAPWQSTPPLSSADDAASPHAPEEQADESTLGNMASMQKVAPADMRPPVSGAVAAAGQAPGSPDATPAHAQPQQVSVSRQRLHDAKAGGGGGDKGAFAAAPALGLGKDAKDSKDAKALLRRTSDRRAQRRRRGRARRVAPTSTLGSEDGQVCALCIVSRACCEADLCQGVGAKSRLVGR